MEDICEDEYYAATIASLQQEKVLLTEKCEHLQLRVEQADTTAAMLCHQLERLQCEHEEVSAEAVSYFNALEKARESQQELQVQLDQARQQAQDPNSRGNSLFAEVEDRRAKTERELVGLRMRHTTLKDQYKFTKEMLHRTKMQFGTLLQMRSDQESSVMQRIRSEYLSCNRELAEIIQNNQQLQEQLNKADKHETPIRGDAGDGKYYVKLLKLKTNEVKQEAADLRDEVSVHRLKALSESHRSVELERRCLLAERSQQSAQGHNFALQQQIHQLRQKI
uniref:LOW QUALITY PROTEIN: protein Spindly-like n=1 Tax=Myxine glutinosa TaxID=7769 RepID=UPI00358EDCD9